jgi:hypothetical protein
MDGKGFLVQRHNTESLYFNDTFESITVYCRLVFQYFQNCGHPKTNFHVVFDKILIYYFYLRF